KNNGQRTNTYNRVHLHFGTVTRAATLPNLGRPYFSGDGNIQVATGGNLTFTAGAVLQASSDVDVIGGTLNLNGSSTNPVVFTSNYEDPEYCGCPDPGDWNGIYVGSGTL